MHAILQEMRLFLLVLTFLACSITRAHALDITVLGGVNYADPTETRSSGKLDWTGNSALSYGASISKELFSPSFELEAGVFYLATEVQGPVSGVDTIRRQHSMQIPVLLRYNFDPWISMGFGGYYASGKGSVEVVSAGTSARQTYASAGLLPDDAGLVLDLRAKLHLTYEVSFVLDGRYEHGLRNLASSSAYVYNTRSIQGMAGLSFEF